MDTIRTAQVLHGVKCSEVFVTWLQQQQCDTLLFCYF